MKKLVILLAICLISVGCSKDKEVGKDVLKGFKEKEAGERIGGVKRSPSPEPSPSPSPPPAPAAAKPSPPPATQAAKLPTINIEINAQGYKPFNLRVFKGTTLKVTNADNQPRSMTSDQQGVFDSGMIAPGGTWTYVANTVGTFNFHDETRPFVVGQLDVVQQ